MYAPDTVTEGETFLWHNVDDRLQVGVALLWKQGAFRGLANYEVVKETEKSPNLRIGLGLQGISTGNPGYFVTTEKTWKNGDDHLGAFVGVGWRANENHPHLIGGGKITPDGGNATLGIQLDGHRVHPFGTYRVQPNLTLGAYWIEMKSLGIMVSLSK